MTLSIRFQPHCSVVLMSAAREGVAVFSARHAILPVIAIAAFVRTGRAPFGAR